MSGGDRLVYFKLLGMAVLWAGTFSAARVVGEVLPPYTGATLRVIFAALVLVPLLAGTEGFARVSRRQFVAIVALAATGFFGFNAFFFTAIREVSAGRASLIVSLTAVVTPLLMWLSGRERLSLVQLSGIALALIGAAVVITRGNIALALREGIALGDLLLLACVASWVAYTLITRAMLRGMSPIATTTYATLAATLMLAVPAAGELSAHGSLSPTWLTWLCAAYTGVFGTAVAFVWFSQGLRAIGASRTAVFVNLVPVFAVLMGVVLLDERVEASLISGGSLAVAGIFLTNWRGPAARS